MSVSACASNRGSIGEPVCPDLPGTLRGIQTQPRTRACSVDVGSYIGFGSRRHETNEGAVSFDDGVCETGGGGSGRLATGPWPTC